MKKNNIIILLTVLLVFLSILAGKFFYDQEKLKSDLHEVVQTYVATVDKKKSMESHLVKKDRLQTMTEGDTLPKNLELKKLNGEPISLHKIMQQNKNPLVIRYSQFDCYSCYEGIWPVLQDFKTENPEQQIIMFANYKNIRDLILFTKRIGLDMKVYNLKEKLPLKIEKFDTPYLFFLKNNRTCQNIYALDKGHLSNLWAFLSNG